MAATTMLRTPTLRSPATTPRLSTNNNFLKSPQLVVCVSSTRTCPKSRRICCSPHYPFSSSHKTIRRLVKFTSLASYGEAAEIQTQTDQKDDGTQEPQLQENSEGTAGVEDGGSEGDSSDTVQPVSAILSSLESYKEALASNDESKIAEIESLLKSIDEERVVLKGKVATLSEELSYEKARVLRISADFDNFRKRTERERLSLVENAQGEVVENLLPVLDNFERAKAQIKLETEGEEKINGSYQSIYKQFVEILGSLGVIPVEPVGNSFDPLLHEAIMREESSEFEEGIIIQEFRKGFKLGDRLLRPSMVKVSAGPGPEVPASVGPSDEEGAGEIIEEGNTDLEPAPAEDL